MQLRKHVQAERKTFRPKNTMQEGLLAGMRSKDHKIRAAAGETLYKSLLHQGKNAMAVSVKALMNPDLEKVAGWEKSSVRAGAAYALAGAARKGAEVTAAFYPVFAGLSDKSPEVQKHCSFALAAMLEKGHAVDKMLREFTKSPLQIKKSILWIVEEASEKNENVVQKFVPAVAQVLSDKDIADYAFNTCRKVLNAGIRHEDPEVREKYKKAFGDNLKNGGSISDSLPPLLGVCNDTAWEVVHAAVENPAKAEEIKQALADFLKKGGRNCREAERMLMFLQVAKMTDGMERNRAQTI
ncbi:hypothetical protein JXA56_01045 [Candidatus Micrarchaeota archaeon]|nr:hypothetical protein [Candidatus Micrarchaeota archaeon]